jgi:hypothetical protein
MASLLIQAFQIQGYAIVGPDWLRSTRYEIIATVPAGANRDDVPLMLRRLITERFGLKFHREKKDVPGYALVSSKNGPTLKQASASPVSIAGRGGFPDLSEGIAPGAMNVDPDSGFDLLRALREQLGLELQTRKASADVLVIDHIEQTPTAN